MESSSKGVSAGTMSDQSPRGQGRATPRWPSTWAALPVVESWKRQALLLKGLCTRPCLPGACPGHRSNRAGHSSYL